MDDHPLGGWRSWVADGTLAGGLMPPGGFAGAVLCARLLQSGGTAHRLWVPLLLLGLVGGAIGAVCSPVLWWAASRAWPRSQLLAFALGPGAGAVGAFALLCPVEWMISGNALVVPWWVGVMIAAAGGMMLGPPWIAYLAVRSRRRRGSGVVAGAVGWATSAGFVLLALLHFTEVL